MDIFLNEDSISEEDITSIINKHRIKYDDFQKCLENTIKCHRLSDKYERQFNKCLDNMLIYSYKLKSDLQIVILYYL